MPDKLAEAVKVFDQYAWAVWLLIFFVLIAPPSLLAPFAVGPFVSQYRPYIGALFLASTVLLLGRIGQAARDSIVPWFANRKDLTRLHDRLRHLTAAEQAVLRGFIGEATRTQSLYWMNGVVVGLEAEKIIYNTAPYGREGLPCPYNMQNWAFAYLNEHPELIGLDRSQIGAPSEVRGIGHVQQEYRDRVRMALQNGRLKGYTVGLDEEWRFTVASYQEWEAAGAPTEPLASKEAHVE